MNCERFGPNCDGNDRVDRDNREFDSRLLDAPEIQFNYCFYVKDDVTLWQIAIATDRTTTITILRITAYTHMI